jgi:DNA polymerase III delta prime subunit
VQQALRLRAHEDGYRAAVIADAEWLNQEAQNALLRLLEEPPPRTTLVLVAATASGLLATVRSRCQRVAFARPEARLAELPERAALAERLDAVARLSLPELLDWAEEFRGARADAAANVAELLETAGLGLRERIAARAGAGDTALRLELDAFRDPQACRKALAQRNANPQMVAERALLALRGAVA